MLVQVDVSVNCDLYFFRTLHTSFPLHFYIILGISDYLITIVMYNTTLSLKLDWNIILNCLSLRIRFVRLFIHRSHNEEYSAYSWDNS
jgi:hypothetical protein